MGELLYTSRRTTGLRQWITTRRVLPLLAMIATAVMVALLYGPRVLLAATIFGALRAAFTPHDVALYQDGTMIFHRWVGEQHRNIADLSRVEVKPPVIPWPRRRKATRSARKRSGQPRAVTFRFGAPTYLLGVPDADTLVEHLHRMKPDLREPLPAEFTTGIRGYDVNEVDNYLRRRRTLTDNTAPACPSPSFAVRWRGYDRDEVDDYLARLPSSPEAPITLGPRRPPGLLPPHPIPTQQADTAPT